MKNLKEKIEDQNMQRNYKETMLINKFINMIMIKGKKQKAAILFKNCFKEIKKRKKNPFFIFKKAVLNSLPVLYFKLKKRGSRIFKLPAPIKEKKATFLCLKWIIDGAHSKLSHSTYNNFSKKLAAELLDTSKGFGYAIKKKNELYNIILDNRPFLRYKN
jgi:small subunit ribosomal protein S7